MKTNRVIIALLMCTSALAASADAQPAAKTPAYKVVHSYAAGDAFWDYGAFDDAARRLYLGRENGVTAIDVDTGEVIAQFVEGQQVHGIVLLDNGRALATNGASANAMIFERATGKIVAHIPTGEKPDGAALEPVTGIVVIMDSIGHDAVFANPNTAMLLGRLPLEGEPGTPIPDGKGHVFSGITDHSEIVMIDVASRSVLKKMPLPDCLDSGGLALDKETGILLVTCANLKAIMLDSASGRILGSVPIDKYPDVIQFDSTRKLFYVPTISPGNLFVIGEDENGVPVTRAKVPLASGVHTAVLNTKDGLLYVPAGEIHIPKVHGQRPTVEPGTFKVLAVDLKP